jgi:glycosyltransferase involved in cell wall biosynthesis
MLNIISTSSPQEDYTSGRALSLADFDIIYFGNDWFAENRTSSHHIAGGLAKGARLLYVDTPGLRAPKASGRDFRKFFRKLIQTVRRPQPIGTRMWYISTPQIPFRRLPFIRQLNLALGRLLVRRALKRLRFRKTISWFAVPHPGILAGEFDESMIVYYCIDDYAALPDVDAAAVARMDENLMRRADQVFVASARMIEAKKAFNSSVVHAPHGVDISLFQKASDPDYPIADEAKDLRRPVIGFYGLIEAWIDLDLIAFLAEHKPEWTFLMIGRLAVNPGRLRSLPNVRFVGPQPYTTLPAWAKAFDVAIIPYLPTQQVLNSNPLKLREYLATGKPVVAVPTPEIDRFAHCVRIAHSPEEFLRSIEDALENDSPADRARRMDAVAGMSWEARIHEVIGIVENRIRQKEPSLPR